MAEVRISPGAGEEDAPALRVGDVLAVDLPENPTTGYRWSVAALPAQVTELPPEPAAPTEHDDLRPGAGGRRVLRFGAQLPGTGELRLRHGRLWQPAGGEELTIAVRVEPAG